MLGNETVASAGLGWAAAVDDGPVLALDEPEQAVEQIETFFDNMAFEAADPQPRGTAPEASTWSVQDTANKSNAPPGAIGVVDDDDIPVVMGNDLPVVTGQAAPANPAPAASDPFSGLDWVVGEPGKK